MSYSDCLRKMIGGESMGNWFENMEPMNIQEERAKTKKAEEELEESVKAMFKLLKTPSGSETASRRAEKAM